jgi:hypothetical protein
MSNVPWTSDRRSGEVKDQPEEVYELDERTVGHLSRALLSFLEQLFSITLGSLSATALIDLMQYMRGY